ncbi:MAG: site-2 protease family protein [Lewinellaceae bacterium]|nr:site-2 protease family protein [Lewinellaceae bacterium]
MKGSLRIATLFRIPVQLHWSFAFIFVYIIYLGVTQSWGIVGTAWAAFFVITLFTCVILHEFGHALTARYFGIQTRDITLYPIGGVARLDRLPEKPQQELVVALAGPMVNVVIAALLLPLLLSLDAISRKNLVGFMLNPNGNYFLPELPPVLYFFFGLIVLNITLALFNLIPAFPMDGGRVLRALLSIRIGRTQATRIAAFVGQALAVLLIGYTVYTQTSFMHAFIGLFVFVTAAGENRMVRLEDRLDHQLVSQLVRRQFTRFYPENLMGDVFLRISSSTERSFLVFDHWQNLVGILPETRLWEAYRAKDFTVAVERYMLAPTRVLTTEDTLRTALHTLQTIDGGAVPVFNAYHELVGILDVATLNTHIREDRQRQRSRFEQWLPWRANA